MYPYYHPHRSRFFNTVTLYQETASYLLHYLEEYLLTKWNIEDAKIVDSLELAYKNYVSWEESGGKDLQLPGFFLTNRQMFWVALAHKQYFKFHSHSKYKTKFNSALQHFHLTYKNNDHFRDDFNCSELTEDEKVLWNSYQKDSPLALG